MSGKLSLETRLDWLRLIRSDNVGPRTFRALINHYGGAAPRCMRCPIWRAAAAPADPARICSHDEAERELKAATSRGISFLALCEPDYPQRLAMIDDAPPLLAVRGKLAALALPMVAIVGARNASAAGMRFAERLARDLGQRRLCDRVGARARHRRRRPPRQHRHRHVAVLAGGHDRIYPPEHAELADAIAADGALISEMPLGREPRARDFPAPQPADLRARGRAS